MNVVHAHPIVVAMAESRPQEAMVANRYNFRFVSTGQGFVSVSELPTCMVPGPVAMSFRLPPRAWNSSIACTLLRPGMRGVKLSLDNYHDNYSEIIETMAESDDNDHQPATCSDLICRDY